MSFDTDDTAERIYGRVEERTNDGDAVTFVSAEGRKILFRYIGVSLQYGTAAAEYQCTQCKLACGTLTLSWCEVFRERVYASIQLCTRICVK